MPRAALNSFRVGACVVDITNINHVGMAVRDLAETARRYEAMGFQLTPYSPHSAAWKPGEPVKPLTSGNRCVMFENTYLEILASEDPARPAERITNFLKRHQGAHIICFDSDGCVAVDARLRKAGVETSGVIPLQRELDTAEGERTAKFERVQFAPKDTPEGYIQAARHLTPQYIYQPRHIRHENGCTRLSQTFLVALDMDATVARYSTYIGAEPTRDGKAARFDLPLGTSLLIVPAAEVGTILPGTLLPPLPGIAAVTFSTPDVAAQSERLRSRGFTVTNAGGRLVVPAEEACGLAVVFAR